MTDSSIFATRGSPAPDEALRDLEASVGPLPEDYRRFLSEGDGARLVQFNSIIGSEFGGIREIFSLADPDGSYRKLPHVMKVYKDRVPGGFLPIADDQAGNLYLLGLTEPYIGQVYFWDHEFEADEGELPTFDNMHLVARSFQELPDRITVDAA
jgi:hypothetical protein